MNKTQAMIIEDLKNEILAKISDEEIGLGYGSDASEAAWNKALMRCREIVRFEV